MESELLYLLAQSTQVARPVARLSYLATSGYSAGTTGYTIVPFNTTSFSANGMSLGSTTGQLQVPITGYYEISATVAFTSTSSGTLQSLSQNVNPEISIAVNGTLVSRGIRYSPNAGATVVTVNDVVELTASDVVNILMRVPSGTAYAFGGNGDDSYTYFTASYTSV